MRVILLVVIALWMLMDVSAIAGNVNDAGLWATVALGVVIVLLLIVERSGERPTTYTRRK